MIQPDNSNNLRQEEQERERQLDWRSLTEALPQLVWSATPDGACDYFSTQWTEHTGVPEQDLLGWRWLAVLHPDDRDAGVDSPELPQDVQAGLVGKAQVEENNVR